MLPRLARVTNPIGHSSKSQSVIPAKAGISFPLRPARSEVKEEGFQLSLE
jgi:hypothetical protein